MTRGKMKKQQFKSKLQVSYLFSVLPYCLPHWISYSVSIHILVVDEGEKGTSEENGINFL